MVNSINSDRKDGVEVKNDRLRKLDSFVCFICVFDNFFVDRNSLWPPTDPSHEAGPILGGPLLPMLSLLFRRGRYQ